MFLMILNYQIYQKYFEPLFLIILSVIYKNFLVMNVLSKLKNTIIFYSFYNIIFDCCIYKFFKSIHIQISNLRNLFKKY